MTTINSSGSSSRTMRLEDTAMRMDYEEELDCSSCHEEGEERAVKRTCRSPVGVTETMMEDASSSLETEGNDEQDELCLTLDGDMDVSELLLKIHQLSASNIRTVTLQGCCKGSHNNHRHAATIISGGSSRSSTVQPDWNSPAMDQLRDALCSSLTHITRVNLQQLGQCDAGFPMEWITQWLFLCANLQVLSAKDVHFRVHPRAIHDFSHALQRQQYSLREMSWHNCGIWESTLQVCSLDSVLQTLATLAALKVVDWKADEPGVLGDLQAESLAKICHHLSLTSLRLKGFLFVDPQHQYTSIRALTQPLEHHPSLQHLDLECSLTPPIVLQFAQLIENNRSMITLSLTDDTRHERENSTNELQQPQLQQQQDQDAALLEVAQALKSSPNLQSFTLVLPQISISTKQAFCHMLESNYVLQSLQLVPTSSLSYQHHLHHHHTCNNNNNNNTFHHQKKDDGDCPILRHLEFLLSLNRAGRQHLLPQVDQAAIQQWMHVLGANQTLDFVYYFLHRNISLVVNATTTAKDVGAAYYDMERKRKRVHRW